MIWRLIRDGAASGAWNMAVDEALLRHQADHQARPVLRFYDWSPSCLSLGRFQKPFESGGDVDVVRRPSGGRAVWHQHEVTYSATFRLGIVPPQASSVIGSYRWLTEAFLDGLRHLGLVASLETTQTPLKAGDKASRPENCFLASASCDSVVDGRKLIGAAQCRKTIDGQTVVLQHGSLLLDWDVAVWRAIFGGEVEAMRNSVTSLSEMGLTTCQEEIIAALMMGVQRSLGARWQASLLTGAERQTAQRLVERKYGSVQWNRDGRETPEEASFVASSHFCYPAAM